MKNPRIFIIFIFASLLSATTGWAVPLLVQAEQLFNERLYEDALPLYSELNQHNPSPELQWRLVQVHYELGHYAQVIALAKEIVPTNPIAKGHLEIIYLEALASINLDQLEPGADRLRAYLALYNPLVKDSLLHHSEALFELGVIEFSLKLETAAKTAFTAVVQQGSSSKLVPLAQVYLGRIAFEQGDRKEAQHIFHLLQQSLAKEDLLHGEIAYWLGRLHRVAAEYPAAAAQFQRAISIQPETQSEWFFDALYDLGGCYLKLTEEVNLTKEVLKEYFDMSEKAWSRLASEVPEERSFLALGTLYLSKGRRLDDEKAYQAAEEILSKQQLFMSPHAQAKATLMRAEAAPSYAERDRLYRQLTQERISYADGWHMRGLNDFQEGQHLLEKKQPDEAKKMFYQAADSLKQASLLLEASAKEESVMKYQTLALFHSQTDSSKWEAWTLLNQLIGRQVSQDKSELYYLSGLMASHLNVPLAEKNLKEGIDKYPRGSFAPEMIHLLALLNHKDQRYGESELLFLTLAEQFPESPLAGEGWYWAAASAESLQKNDEIIKQYKKNLFEKYPRCRYAADAYLSYYPYRDYLQGSRAPLKHLESMPTQFSHSPLVINAYYLIGLDHKKDHLSFEGRPVRRKNLLAAIDAFQEAESAFDAMYEQNLIPSDQLTYFAALRYRSTLERALSNLAIAENSQGAKRYIYLEYAEEVFKQVVDDFTNRDHTLSQMLLQGEPYHRLWEESEFWLAHTYIQRGNDIAADKLLNQMLDSYRKAEISKGYFLARTWIEKGLIARRRDDSKAALVAFSSAADAAKGKVLSADQRLDLWIQQSLCYKELKQYDQAMRLLSQVINDDAISGMRLKAMFLRADLYELQGRPELAMKQLEATAKKGGEWGKKAEAVLRSQEKMVPQSTQRSQRERKI
jgi:tetratricopeptide (TPR) repeat protein